LPIQPSFRPNAVWCVSYQWLSRSWYTDLNYGSNRSLELELGFTAGVTGQQGMLTSSKHLIPPLICSEVRVCPFSDLHCLHDYRSLFMPFHCSYTPFVTITKIHDELTIITIGGDIKANILEHEWKPCRTFFLLQRSWGGGYYGFTLSVHVSMDMNCPENTSNTIGQIWLKFSKYPTCTYWRCAPAIFMNISDIFHIIRYAAGQISLGQLKFVVVHVLNVRPVREYFSSCEWSSHRCRLPATNFRPMHGDFSLCGGMFIMLLWHEVLGFADLLKTRGNENRILCGSPRNSYWIA
jgi:hypothetical protein